MAGNESLGFVEVKGLVAAFEASDAMVKAARVRIKTITTDDAGQVFVVCEGDLASCGAAVDAAKAAVARMGTVVNSHLIPRPDGDTETLVDSRIGSIVKSSTAKPKAAAKAPKAKGKK